MKVKTGGLAVLAVGTVRGWVTLTSGWRGSLLFLMLVVVLVENVVRSARQ